MADNPFIERYRDRPDAELIDLAVRRRSEFQDEAVLAAEQLLEERGVSVADARRELDDAERHRRQLMDEVRARVEEEKAQEIQRLAEAGRESGRCLMTGEPATTETVIHLRRNTSSMQVGNTTVTSFDVLPVPIPLSDAAAAKHRPIRILLKRLPIWLVLVVFFGALFWPMVMGMIFAGEKLDPLWLGLALMAGPFAIVLLLTGIEAGHEHLVLGRLFRAHPLHAELKARGYVAVPAERTGQPKLELYAQQLTYRTSGLKAHAEDQLSLLGGSDVVERMIELLARPVACESAMRVLGRLRANEAIPAIAELAEHKKRSVRETAHDVLENLTAGSSDRYRPRR